MAGNLSGAVSDASTAVGQLSTRIEDAQGRVAQLNSEVNSYITLGVAVVSLLLIWLLLVHLGLFAFARRVRNA